MKGTIYAALLLAGMALAVSPAHSEEEGVRLPPVTHEATARECSACHVIYPPQMLPARSWTKIMSTLPDHFGEDATLQEDVRADIAAYLAANAADSPAVRADWFLRRIASTDTPLRITETPWWARAHHEISKSVYDRPEVKSASNCQACHRTADRGEFYEVD